MVTGGNGLSVVIADGGGDDAAVVAVEALDVPIEREIFAVFVVAAMADHVPDVVQHRGGFEQNARVRRQMMHGLKLIEKHDTEFADMLGMLLIVFQTPRECARTN